jgi:tetratricopeptide (TPR) repeat protein
MMGDVRHAEASYHQAMQGFEKLGLENTYDGVNCLQNLSFLPFLRGDAKGAESALRNARARASRAFSPEHPLTLGIQYRLARALSDQGQWREAEEILEATLATWHRIPKSDPGRTAFTGVLLARVLIERGELKRAESLLADARTVFRQSYAGQPRLAAAAENWLGAVYLARKDFVKAAEYLLPLADQFLLPTIQMSPEERRVCIGHIVSLYQARNEPAKAEEWQKNLGRVCGVSLDPK